MPCAAYDSDQLREALKFPRLYFSLSVDWPDRDWCEPLPADVRAELKKLASELKGTPSDAPLRFRISRLHARLRQDEVSKLALAQSTKLFGELVEADPRDADGLFGYAQALRTAGRFQEAVEVLNKLLALRPKSWEAWAELGRIYEDLSDSLPPGDPMADAAAKADKCYGKAVGLAPCSPTAFYLRFRHQLRVSGAAVAMSTASDSDCLHIALNPPPDARRDPVFLSLLARIAVIYVTTEPIVDQNAVAQRQAMLEMYEQELEGPASSSEAEAWRAYEALGLVETVSGNKQDGLMHFRKAFELNPSADVAYNALLVDCRTNGRLADAIPLIVRRTRSWESAIDSLRLSRVYAELGRLDLAEEQCRRSIQLDSLNADAQYMAGVLMLKRFSSVPRALHYLEKALELGLEEGLDDCRLALAAGYLLMQDEQRAIGILEMTDLPEAKALLKELSGDKERASPGSYQVPSNGTIA